MFNNGTSDHPNGCKCSPCMMKPSGHVRGCQCIPCLEAERMSIPSRMPYRPKWDYKNPMPYRPDWTYRPWISNEPLWGDSNYRCITTDSTNERIDVSN